MIETGPLATDTHRRLLPRIHAVTKNEILTLPDFRHRAAELARSPDVALHVRGTVDDRKLTELADLTTALCTTTGAGVWINDRADIARIVGARGVHLPQHGLPCRQVRDIVGTGALIGRSAHSQDEARAAADEGVDYVFLGPIWETPSHPQIQPLGVVAISSLRIDIPIVAIGGVTPERVPAALDAGAHGIAAISALWAVPDRASALDAMLLSFSP